MLRRYELSDEQWALIAPLLPSAQTGRPRRDDRTTPGGVFWKLCSGAAWRDVPTIGYDLRYGRWRTVYDRFARYRDDGTFDRILMALRLRLDATGHIDYATWMIDSTVVRVSRAAAGARKKGDLLSGRPGARAKSRRADHQAAPGLGRKRAAAGCVRDGRAKIGFGAV